MPGTISGVTDSQMAQPVWVSDTSQLPAGLVGFTGTCYLAQNYHSKTKSCQGQLILAFTSETFFGNSGLRFIPAITCPATTGRPL